MLFMARGVESNRGIFSMIPPDYKLLIKSANSPGLLTTQEIKTVNDWIKFFNSHLKAYKEAFGEPFGFSVDVRIENLNWYEKERV